jgi:hypothetical protein
VKQKKPAPRDALAKGRAPEVVEAVRAVTEENLGLLAELEAAYWRLAEAGARADPGCLAKQALLDSLDQGELLDSRPFTHALGYHQYEAARGQRRDSAGNLRARGALALARLSAPGLLAPLGALLADPLATVRQNAARAVAHYGNPDGAGLLLLRLSIGDEPSIEIECLHGLFALTPRLAAETARRMLLQDTDTERREILVNALGSASHDAAIEVLTAQLQETVVASERKSSIEALALSRRAPAREALLALLEEGTQADALAVIAALAPHRYDARLVEGMRAAVQKRGDGVIDAELDARFRTKLE